MTVININGFGTCKDQKEQTIEGNGCKAADNIEIESLSGNIARARVLRNKKTACKALKEYLIYVLPFDILKVLVCFVLLYVFILFLRQSKYIRVDSFITFSSNDIEYAQTIKYDVVDETNKHIHGNEIYEYMISETKYILQKPAQCSNIPETLRFDCHPEDGASEQSCSNRGCCWNPGNRSALVKRVPLNVPYCYYPKGWHLYKYRKFEQFQNEFSGFLQQTGNSFYKSDIPLLKVEGTSIDKSIYRIKIYDASNKRYEPPWPIRPNSQPSGMIENSTYNIDNDMRKPGFRINRTEDGTPIFDSINIGGFIFADQFLQISTLLPSHNIYGIGEHQTNFKLNTKWESFTLFNRDQPPTEHANVYGSHPFYLVMEESGKSHGVLFLNSNAMDVILQPAPAVTFRTIGGIFDIYFFMGPTPTDVIRQYSEIVGKPFLPPYWSLGFHLCRYGYGSLEKTKEVWNRTRAAGIPFDTQWNDLDYMANNNDFTYDKNKFKELPQFVDELHSLGMHYIPLIDAGVSASETHGTYPPYDEGVKQDIFVKDGLTNKPFIGKVWNPVSTVWPDFTNPKTKTYFTNMMNNMYQSFAYDGAWIDMNEPSNFYDGGKNGCPKNKLDYPVYTPNVLGGVLATKTLCMNAKHYLGSHYDLHNTYGISEAVVVNYALSRIRLKRPFIISRSTWVGIGHYAGHWTGDVSSSWHDMRMSIPGILSSSLYQIPMVGADICGFNDNTTVALCNRWMQLGAFYPFSRNHNSDSTIEQDPVAMGSLVVKSSKRALTIRYWLLPYLYTLFFRAHKFGETVARPLFFEFTKDSATYDIDTQFMWGSSLMIIPVLEENKTEVNCYVPRGLWYDLYTKKPFFAIGKTYTLPAPLDTIPLLIRGGSILPAHKPGTTTTESRKNRFELWVALDHLNTSKGELYWDDGDSLDSYKKKDFLWVSFTVKDSVLSSTQVEDGLLDDVILGRIHILGVQSVVSEVYLNNSKVPFKYALSKSCLSINGLQVNLKRNFQLRWEYPNSQQNETQTIM